MSIESAEKKVEAAERLLKEAREELTKSQNYPIEKHFADLVKKHGFDLVSYEGEDMKPRLEKGILRIRFPNANKNWTHAIFKACIEFCEEKPDRFPRWGYAKEGELAITL